MASRYGRQGRLGQARPNEFRERVTLYTQTEGTSANTDGQVPETEREIGRRWAKIIPLRGQERFLANQTQGDVSHVVRLRYDKLTKTLTRKMWLVIEASSERLNIEAVYDPDRRQREIQLECKQRT